jgi:hypothetical protein
VIDLPALEFWQERFLDEGVEVLVPRLLSHIPVFVGREHVGAFGR